MATLVIVVVVVGRTVISVSHRGARTMDSSKTTEAVARRAYDEGSPGEGEESSGAATG